MLTAHVPVFATNYREPGTGYLLSDNWILFVQEFDGLVFLKCNEQIHDQLILVLFETVFMIRKKQICSMFLVGRIGK